MEEQLPINYNGDQEFIATRHNMSLFTFIGESSFYDHVFLQMQETENNRAQGMYIFTGFAAYEGLKKFIEDNNFPQHLNSNDVAECDIQAWNNYQFADLAKLDSFPEEWGTPDEAQS